MLCLQDMLAVHYLLQTHSPYPIQVWPTEAGPAVNANLAIEKMAAHLAKEMSGPALLYAVVSSIVFF